MALRLFLAVTDLLGCQDLHAQRGSLCDWRPNSSF